MSRSITLGHVAQRAQVLAMACTRCERAGRYPVASLIARYGASCPVPLLLRRLSADCPKRLVESQVRYMRHQLPGSAGAVSRVTRGKLMNKRLRISIGATGSIIA